MSIAGIEVTNSAIVLGMQCNAAQDNGVPDPGTVSSDPAARGGGIGGAIGKC